MFWSGETLREKLRTLSADFKPEAVDCNAWTLSVGERIYITPTSNITDLDQHSYKSIKEGEGFKIPTGQFAFLETAERVKVPDSAMAFISIKATIKLEGLINISGFHVDPGFEGRLIFAVYNAGPMPIDLERGQNLFLVWFANLDRRSDLIKTDATERRVDADTIRRIRGRLQSVDHLYHQISTLKEEIRALPEAQVKIQGAETEIKEIRKQIPEGGNISERLSRLETMINYIIKLTLFVATPLLGAYVFSLFNSENNSRSMPSAEYAPSSLHQKQEPPAPSQGQDAMPAEGAATEMSIPSAGDGG